MNHFSKTILLWYETNARNLPWRQTSNPYDIWISEIILQQTRVAQGYDYYLRFIQRFPDINTLAQADEEEVLRYWQGLGYYSRARNLHQAAKSMKNHFPTNYEDILQLKGVGEYTAAAICSIAYNLPKAAVDGNVYRVLSRYLGIHTPIDSTEGKKLFTEKAQSLLDKQQPGRYNQAIMDFGALQCIPVSPDCSICPLHNSCAAFQEDIVSLLPVKQHHTQITNRYFHYIYVRTEKYTWLHKRTAKDIWKNLYELPLIESSAPLEKPEDILKSQKFQHLFDSIDKLPSYSFLYQKKHVLTHRTIYASFYRMDINEEKLPDDFIRIYNKDWVLYPMPQLIHLFFEKYG